MPSVNALEFSVSERKKSFGDAPNWPKGKSKKEKPINSMGPVLKTSLSHLVFGQEGVVDLGADVEERVAHPEDALLEGHFVEGGGGGWGSWGAERGGSQGGGEK